MELPPTDQNPPVEISAIPRRPRGLTAEQFTAIARGLSRTTFTGERGPDGTPITYEGQIVAVAMELNRLRHEQEREN